MREDSSVVRSELLMSKGATGLYQDGGQAWNGHGTMIKDTRSNALEFAINEDVLKVEH